MEPFEILTLVVGYVLAGFAALLGLLVIYKMWTGDIKLDGLLIEGTDGKASLSRFQFLVFTFVIALSLFLVIVGQKPVPAFPEIPGGIFGLLGISGGSYLLSKGVQKNSENRNKELELEYEVEKERIKAGL